MVKGKIVGMFSTYQTFYLYGIGMLLKGTYITLSFNDKKVYDEFLNKIVMLVHHIGELIEIFVT